MNITKYAGLIECGDPIVNRVQSQSEFDGFQLKKVHVKQDKLYSKTQEYYPNAELVEDISSIFGDQSIELVIVSRPGESDLTLVAEAIGAGKQVRVL